MKQVRSLLVLLALVIFILPGCKKDIKDEQSALSGIRASNMERGSSAKLTAAQVEQLKKIRSSFPEGYEKRMEKSLSLMADADPVYRDMVKRALNLVPTECSSTPLSDWLDEQLADWTSEVIIYAIITGMLDFPTYDALLFENSSNNQYFGVEGQNTQRMTKTFKDIKRFWNINTDNIVLAAMHGSMLRDREKVIRIDMILYGDSRPVAEYWADVIQQLLDIFPQYQNGDHPIFTFNAFAQRGIYFPPYGQIPPKIIMGDGVLQGYEAIGYNDVAPQAVFAHEFGHHIQFQLNLFGSTPSPEATRRTELMADAFAAYYLSHARGASMQWKRVQQFLAVFFNVGDCSFTSEGHHGTPLQRMAAANWGYSIANNAQKQGHILTAQQFTALFEAKLPELVAP